MVELFLDGFASRVIPFNAGLWQFRIAQTLVRLESFVRKPSALVGKL